MIIIISSNGPMLFDSPEEACDYMEAADVERGEYEAFDEGGNELNLYVEHEVANERTIWQRVPLVRLEPQPAPRRSADESRIYLRSKIAAVLEAQTGMPVSPDRSLDSLIEQWRRLGGD